MPPVDLENLVSACAGGCNDNKVACETLADASTDGDTTEEDDVNPDGAAYVDPDFPPESFWLSKDAEYDWFDRNAFYDRTDSGRGNANLNAGANSTSNSNSQRFSVHRKSRAAMIGLPKTQKTTYVDSKRRTSKTANVRLFPKRPEPAGKSVAEPGSPKVSCMGRVRSKRGRRRSKSNSSRSRREKAPLEKSRSGGEKQKKAGFYSKVMSMFRSKKGRKKAPRSGSRRVAEEEPQRRSMSSISKVREIPVSGEMAAGPPGLGGVKRFVSGRRSDSWAGEDFSQSVSGSLDSGRHVGVVSWS